ncbi:MAG TPA: S9 family peptidase [Bryobacteraceae bacterium]|nr:S9 family peptidase [Bryobacteraceae bacterium]
MLPIVLFAAASVLAQPLTPVEPALAEITATRRFTEVALSPDGARVAYVERGTAPSKSSIYLSSVPAGAAQSRLTAGKMPCDEHGLAWSSDGRRIAFLSDCAKPGQLQLYLANPEGGPARQLTHFKGLLADPRWSPDDKQIAILFTENLPREAGPLDPVLHQTGVIDSKIYEQRLALVDVSNGASRILTPPDLYVYEYDWSPDGKQFAAIAAHGDGDDNWWIAQLYTIDVARGYTEPIYRPPVQQQIAAPHWSRDGQSIVFIGGLMSDEGSTGGDIFQVSPGGGAARNLTPGLAASASSITWPRESPQLYFTEHFDGGSAISRFDSATGKLERLWHGDETITPLAQDTGLSFSANGKISALIRSSFQTPPEVWAGPIGSWQPVTHENRGRTPPWGEAKSLHWSNDGFHIQGWLLYPTHFDAARKYPLIVSVHGGPASSLKPAWPSPGFNPLLLSQQGYFVLMPNPRGSYGQGEAFTVANVKDFGGGDLRDIIAGIDEAVRSAPIDPQRVGITGWSYGGYMTMWAVTQTNRFRAAVAGAGLANWQSYYGENAIDQWMIPYFGASVYADPAVYAKSSPINFIRQAKTPTLMLVGDSDAECPPAQSYEFWHALKTLDVKTQLVVYANEGHRFTKPADQRDVLLRMIRWFNANL